MNVNPMMLLQLKGYWERFRENHPKFPQFMKAAAGSCIKEGSVVSISVQTPEGKKMETNLRLTPEDVELYHLLMEMREQ